MFKSRIIVPILNNKKISDNPEILKIEKKNSNDDYNIREIL
jgi:hypothetical protein